MINRRNFLFASSAVCTCAAHQANANTTEDPEKLLELDTCTELFDMDFLRSRETALEHWDGNNDSSGEEAVGRKRQRWQPDIGRLNVDFLETSPIIDKVIAAAKKWEPFMNLRFKFGEGEPHILIGFTAGGGHNSYVGTDCLSFARKGKKTMNFGWSKPPVFSREINRVVLHEFGHALGLTHEHFHPNSSIPWNKPAVYELYKRTQGWSEDDVDHNLFSTLATTSVNRTKYDPDSIMHYPIPRELLLDASYAVSWNTRLSDLDKAMVKFLFPSV